MAELSVPQIDFSSIGKLPQVYQQAQNDALRRQTLASLGQGGQADADALLRSGDLSLANLGISMRNRQEDQARQATQDARQAGRDKTSDSHWAASFELQKRAAERADRTPVDIANDRAAVAQKYGIDPNSPEGRQFVVTGQMPQTLSDTATQRAAVARQYGIDPASQEGRAFILGGKLPDQSPPDGFAKQQDGSLAPIPGGPQDPAYLASRTKAESAAKGDAPQIIGPGSSIIVPNKAAEGPVFTNKVSGGGLSQDALDIRAAQWNNGDYEGATKNVGRGAQGGATLEAIANRAAERLIEQGHSPEQAAALTSQNMQKFRASGIGQNAESRTGATREANLNLVLKATEAAIPAALEQSEKVARTGWVPINKIIQGGQVMTSDPELRKFGMANLQLAEHWARAMNPTGVMRESDRDLALHFLSTADSKDTYKQVVGQLKTQITRERDAIRGGNSDPAAAANAGLKAKYGLD